MRKISQITHLEMVFLCLTALMAAVFIHCDQVYDNPVSDRYEGEYKCIVNWNALNTSTPEILKSYSITVNDTGKDKYYKFEVTTDPAVRFKSDTISSKPNSLKIIQLFFVEPFKGKLSVVAMRPNFKKDSYSTSVNIGNPYRVSGDTLVGRNVPANLFISRIDTLETMDTEFTVIWDTSSIPFDSASVADLVTLRYGNNDSVKVNATISTKNGSYKLPPFTVRFQGHAPVIELASLRDAPLHLGAAPVIDVKFSDDDTGIVAFSVFATAHNKFLTSVPFNATGNSTTISTAIICDEVISDTSPTSLSIIVKDKDGLLSEPKIIGNLKVSYDLPEVEFLKSSDTLFFKYGTYPRFFASGKADSFLWVVDSNALIKTTKENTVELSAIMDTLWHTIRLKGFNLTGVNGFYLYSRADKITYKAKYSKYTIKKINFPSTLKTKKWFSWEVNTVDAIGSKIGSDSIRYVWTYPKDKCMDSLNEDSSSLFLYFSDSIKNFTVEVKAIVGKELSSLDTTAPLIEEVITRIYKPKCDFDSINPDTVKLNDSVGIKVNFQTTDPAGCPIDTVFYSIKSPTNSFIEKKNPIDAWGYKFKEKGWYNIITWVIDSDNNRSDNDTLKVYVSTDKPVFNPLILKKTVYAKDSLLLTASTETNPDSIHKYFWDLDNNGTVDMETDSNFIYRQFEKAGICTLKVNCISISNDSAALPLIIVVTVLSSNPVIKSVTHSNPVYINDKCTFTIHAEDYGKNKGITKYLVSTDTVAFSAMSDSSFDTTFKSPGSKYLYFKVLDNLNLPSIYYRDSIQVRSGIPEISNVDVKYTGDSLYVKDKFDMTIVTKDTNGTISKVCVSWNNDTIAEDSIIYVSPVSACTSQFFYSFDTSSYGNRNVKIWAIDDDKQKSVENETIKVSKGAPVITGVWPMETWVKKNTTVVLNSVDVNGPIIKRWIDWNGNGVWDDSSIVKDTFVQKWDTTVGDKYTVFNTKVMDEDTFFVTKVCSVLVKMGRPILTGASFGDSIQWVSGAGTGRDTMFYVMRSIDVPIMINAVDDNGTIIKFYWDLDTNGLNVTSTTPKWIANSLQANVARGMRVYAVDNDSINSFSLTFIIYPDEPPPVPEVSFEKKENQQIKIIWRYEDAKEGQNTKYAITLGSSNPNRADTLIAFSKGTSSCFQKVGEWYSHTFKPLDIGYTSTFNFKVIAKDDRGSISPSNATTVLYP